MTTTGSMNGSAHATGRYVVLGGRGKTGGRVAQRLRALGHDVVDASRSTPQRFDWDDPTTWEPTLAGATGLYATYFPDIASPGAHENVGRLAEVARGVGIERAALLSGRGEPGALLSERAFLDALPDSDVLRCAWFDQNFTEGMFAPAIAAGGYSLPTPAHVVEPFLDADDVADCAVRVLTGDHLGGVHELTGPVAVSMDEVAATLSEVMGGEVRYEHATLDEFAATLGALGMSYDDAMELAHALAETFDGRNAATTDVVPELLGRPARSFATFARAAYDAGQLPSLAVSGRP
jgi:uncharacterized protein YbjT (DUF2867 family)